VIPDLFSKENPKLISPMGRPATPSEIAYASLYFASEESSYCTGSVLAVDGGATGRA
jgi:NAD(P)-dependent dehydrogenase (short-subunit alcohol dehydrogenase family)